MEFLNIDDNGESYAGNLLTVAHQFETSKFLLVLLDELEEIAEWTKGSDELQSVAETDADKSQEMRVTHAGHQPRLP